MIVLQQPVQQCLTTPGNDDEWQFMKQQRFTRVALVIVYFLTELRQDFLSPPAVIKTMKMNFETRFVQCFQLIEDINNATVIRGMGHVERDNMKMRFNQYS